MSDEPWVGPWRPHRPRGPIAALYSGPGPKYGLPTNVGYHLHDPSRDRAPAYSFGLRLEALRGERSPGPAYMLPPGTTVRGPAGPPAYSIYSRPRDWAPPGTPGPGRYSPERADQVVFPTAPACSLRSRTRHFGLPQTPGPAAYRLPPMLGPRTISKPSAPNFSMPGRSNVGAFYQDLRKTPAPSTYRVVDADVYQRRAPQYSMVGRTPLPTSRGPHPGPGDYNPHQEPPRGQTFGIRHSQFVAPLLLDAPD